MAKTVLVLGGTGTLGRRVAGRLAADGHQVAVTSRRPAAPGAEPEFERRIVDLTDGSGLDTALADVDTVVDCATVVRDAAATRNLLDGLRGAGWPHLLYVSIVGVDRVPFPYYKQKLAAERLIEDSAARYTIQRATQFHDLLRALLAGAARLPVQPLPNLPFQPVDTADVAERIAELVDAGPSGRVPDFGGPEVRSLPELAAEFAEATGKHRPVWPLWLPGKTFRAYRAGHHTTPEHADGRITFADYLAGHADPARAAYREPIR